MSQIILCKLHNGCVISIDTHVSYERDYIGEQIELKNRIALLGSYCFAVSIGAVIGIYLLENIAELVKRMNAKSYDEVSELAIFLLNAGYSEYVRLSKDWYDEHPDAFKDLYIVIGGLSRERGTEEGPIPRAYLLVSKDRKIPFEIYNIGELFFCPRRLGMEMKLWETLSVNPKLDDVIKRSLEILDNLSNIDETIRKPFQYAVVTTEGLKVEES